MTIISVSAALLAMGAAWAAVFVNRWNVTDTIDAQVNMAARTSRATVVSNNRQKWIDAIRDDVAEFSAARSQAVVVKSMFGHAGSVQGADALATEERQLRAKLHMLRSRVEMRLNLREPDHAALMDAMDKYGQSADHQDDLAMRIAARAIFKPEWERLKKEASGIDPFVREAVPRRLPAADSADGEPRHLGEGSGA